MMRRRMMLIGNSDVRERARAQLARKDHREHSRDVGLPGKRDQIEHHLCVFIKRIGHIDRPFGKFDRVRALLLRVLNALLDFAHRIHVFVQLRVISVSQRFRQRIHFLGDRIENAPGVLHASQALSRASTVAEQALEDDARMCFRRIRCRGITPRNGVDVEAVTRIAGTLSWEVDGQFERGELRILSDFVCSDLIGSRRKPYFNARLRAIVRMHAGEPCRRRARMIARSIAERVRLQMREAADNVQITLHRLERLENRRQLESCSDLLRLPLLLDHTIRYIDEAKPRNRLAGGRQRGHHRIEKRQSHADTCATQERSS